MWCKLPDQSKVCGTTLYDSGQEIDKKQLRQWLASTPHQPEGRNHDGCFRNFDTLGLTIFTEIKSTDASNATIALFIRDTRLFVSFWGENAIGGQMNRGYCGAAFCHASISGYYRQPKTRAVKIKGRCWICGGLADPFAGTTAKGDGSLCQMPAAVLVKIALAHFIVLRWNKCSKEGGRQLVMQICTLTYGHADRIATRC